MWNDIKTIQDEAEHVTKFVFTNKDAVAEAVLYRYPTYQERTVICCSTQSGCPVGCRFCGAGDAFVRSLTKDEIIEQVIHCLQAVDCKPIEIEKLQIMFMSMGEPLLNLKHLVPAIKDLKLMYPTARLLISTSAPKVDYDSVIDVSKQVDTVGLQFSIHESTNEARDLLIPFKAKLTLEEIAVEGKRWFEATGRNPYFNYCAHDKNNSDVDADRLMVLFDPKIWCATVSVICERGEGMKARNDYQREMASSFDSKLVERGYDTRMFDPAGQDTVGGGCGQLWHLQDWLRKNPDKIKKSCGSGKAKIHAPIGV